MKIKYYGDTILPNEKSIVLCGPTPRDSHTLSWRPEALKIFEDLNFEGTVFVPEYSSSSFRFNNHIEQLNWEREVYLNCSVMLFWVPRHFPDMLGLTTNVEFGYWLKSEKCIYGRPEYAERIGSLDWLYSLEYNKEPYNNLKDLIEASIALVNKISQNEKEIL